MTAHGLGPFLDPRRVVVVVPDREKQREATADASEDIEPNDAWRFPGVEQHRVTPTALDETALQPGDLLVVDGPAYLQREVVESLEGSGETSVALGGEPPESGTGLESSIRDLDGRVLGPGAAIRLPAVSAGRDERNGGQIAVLASDPMVATPIEEWATATGIQLGPVVATGAELDLGFGEMAAALAEHPSTDLVLGRSDVVQSTVIDAFRGVETDTPVAVYPGNGPDLGTEPGFEVAGSRVSRTVLEQAGMVPVESLERMLDGGPALANQPLPEPASVVVVSNAGGPGVMGIDAVGASGLDVARLSEETIERLEGVVPDHGSARNPLDLLADSGIDVFEAALDASLEDENVGAAIVMSAPSAIFSFEELAEVIVEARRRHELPIVTALMGGSRTERPAAILREAGIPNYFDPYRAVGALDLLRRHAETGPARRLDAGAEPEIDVAALDQRLPPDDQTVLEGQDAAGFVEALGLGAVANGAGDELEVFLEGIRCPDRGPVVAVGVSEFAAAVGDVSARGVPVAKADAAAMLEELRAAPVLQGARGREATNTEPVQDAILGLSALLERWPSVGRVSTSLWLGDDGPSVERVTVASAGQ